uniref:Uncharacterized protein n=1 Tax=Fagus sylvatica TaxID=28930 RepID=A0A2N9GDF7_FAGSY
MIRPRPWKPRTIWIEIHFNWVFAEAYQLEDLFMEPWVEATCGGEGEIWVCSSRSVLIHGGGGGGGGGWEGFGL